eukprot:6204541-Pleurochrysis_carterae.AAC.1
MGSVQAESGRSNELTPLAPLQVERMSQSKVYSAAWRLVCVRESSKLGRYTHMKCYTEANAASEQSWCRKGFAAHRNNSDTQNDVE